MREESFQPHYGHRPWLTICDAPQTGEFFKANGGAFGLARGESLDFGRGHFVFWIERGLIATFPFETMSEPVVMGLFGPRTVLGSVMVLSRRENRMAIAARALADVSGWKLSASVFRDWALGDPERAQEFFCNCVGKTECQLEGSVANDLLTVPGRLALLFQTLLQGAGLDWRREESYPLELPWPLTVTDLASIVHAERSRVSAAVSRFTRAGILGREGRRMLFLSPPRDPSPEGS